MRLKAICCEIMAREACLLAATSPHTCDLEFLPKGLHDLGVEKMVARVQERVTAVEAGRYDAIILGYGLCNNGIAGVSSPHTRIVVPRAHDCITLFMGDRTKYMEYFNSHPGTYYRTTGWYERNDSGSAGEITITQKLGLFLKFDELVRQYGEENAQYIMETMGDGTVNYDRITFISVGIAGEDLFREKARGEAAGKGWKFDDIPGSLELLKRIFNGDWQDRDCVVLKPGEAVKPSYDDGVIKAG